MKTFSKFLIFAMILSLLLVPAVYADGDLEIDPDVNVDLEFTTDNDSDMDDDSDMDNDSDIDLHIDPMNPGPVIDPQDESGSGNTKTTLDKANDLKTFGLFIGSDNGFELESGFTRAEAATMLVRVFQLDVVDNTNAADSSFIDAPVDEWFYTFVDTAFKAGMIKGVSETEFAPEEGVTGAQFATMLMRGIYPEEAGDISPETVEGFLVTRTSIDVEKAQNLITKASFTRGDMVEMLYDVYFLTYVQNVFATAEVPGANQFSVTDGSELNVKVKENQLFSISVPASALEGYTWFYSISNAAAVEFIHSKYIMSPLSGEILGSDGEQVFYFKALSKDQGEVFINLVSKRASVVDEGSQVQVINIVVE